MHQVRHSLRYVGWKERKTVVADLRAIYNAVNLGAAEDALEAIAAKWDEQYPTISQSWKKNWAHLLIVIFDFAPEIRKAIYTSNAIESLNASLRKVTKTRCVFPTDESLLKLLYLALHNIYLGKMDDAHQGLETRHESIYADVWRPGDTMTIWPFTQKISQTRSCNADTRESASPGGRGHGHRYCYRAAE